MNQEQRTERLILLRLSRECERGRRSAPLRGRPIFTTLRNRNDVTLHRLRRQTQVHPVAAKDYTAMNNFAHIITDILHTVEVEEEFLRSLTEETLTTCFNPQKRNIKMLIGHLIDSASNNHQRMVRLQYAPRCGHSMPGTEMGMLVFPDYTQDNDLWIHLQDYRNEDWDTLLGLWKHYCMHIAHLIRAVDVRTLDNYWTDYEGNRVTLRQMIEGFTVHLHLHLRQIHELAEGNR